MAAIVCCQEHDASKRVLFDMCETDETGEVNGPIFSFLFETRSSWLPPFFFVTLFRPHRPQNFFPDGTSGILPDI